MTVSLSANTLFKRTLVPGNATQHSTEVGGQSLMPKYLSQGDWFQAQLTNHGLLGLSSLRQVVSQAPLYHRPPFLRYRGEGSLVGPWVLPIASAKISVLSFYLAHLMVEVPLHQTLLDQGILPEIYAEGKVELDEPSMWA